MIAIKFKNFLHRWFFWWGILAGCSILGCNHLFRNFAEPGHGAGNQQWLARNLQQTWRQQGDCQPYFLNHSSSWGMRTSVSSLKRWPDFSWTSWIFRGQEAWTISLQSTRAMNNSSLDLTKIWYRRQNQLNYWKSCIQVKNAFGTIKNSSATAMAWKKQMPSEKVKEVEKACVQPLKVGHRVRLLVYITWYGKASSQIINLPMMGKGLKIVGMYSRIIFRSVRLFLKKFALLLVVILFCGIVDENSTSQ